MSKWEACFLAGRIKTHSQSKSHHSIDRCKINFNFTLQILKPQDVCNCKEWAIRIKYHTLSALQISTCLSTPPTLNSTSMPQVFFALSSTALSTRQPRMLISHLPSFIFSSKKLDFEHFVEQDISIWTLHSYSSAKCLSGYLCAHIKIRAIWVWTKICVRCNQQCSKTVSELHKNVWKKENSMPVTPQLAVLIVVYNFVLRHTFQTVFWRFWTGTPWIK